MNALVAETGRMDSAVPAEAAGPGAESSDSAGRTAAPPRRGAGSAPFAFTALSPAAASLARVQARQSAALPDGGPAAAGSPGAIAVSTLPTGAGLLAALRNALQIPQPGSGPLAGPDAAGEQAGGEGVPGRVQSASTPGAAEHRAPGQGAGAAAGADLTGSAAPLDGLPTPAGSDAVAQADGSLPDALAEQLAYWAADRLQGAELTLALEGAPLQVRVLVEGDNAQVDFRSDEGDTRDLLDAGTGQLRELLDQEGLVLSDVSVGSGAQQPAGQPPRDPGGHSADPAARVRARQAPLQGAALSGAAPGEGVAVRPRVPSERRLDVFA